MDIRTIFGLTAIVMPVGIVIAVLAIYICSKHVDNNTFGKFLAKIGVFNVLGAAALLAFSLIKIYWQ